MFCASDVWCVVILSLDTSCKKTSWCRIHCHEEDVWTKYITQCCFHVAYSAKLCGMHLLRFCIELLYMSASCSMHMFSSKTHATAGIHYVYRRQITLAVLQHFGRLAWSKFGVYRRSASCWRRVQDGVCCYRVGIQFFSKNTCKMACL